jgi:hypothetical protein
MCGRNIQRVKIEIDGRPGEQVFDFIHLKNYKKIQI